MKSVFQDRLITARKRSYEKVMFLHVFVRPRRGEGSAFPQCPTMHTHPPDHAYPPDHPRPPHHQKKQNGGRAGGTYPTGILFCFEELYCIFDTGRCVQLTIKIHVSHFAYACKMRYPLNLVLENSEYLWFY